ncbi:MAG TPA: type II toxin-antitoxin system death-on-curing family toxin [Chthoniobacteraceae bacterium]|nr:type II toxin-antitoxin system death-on-curing family toxin [Chthoniobacteraceae bacterium]
MNEPLFLTAEQVERLHQKLIDCFGGLHGLRDPLLYEGAVIQPRNVYYYAQGDLFDVAAAYAFHIAQAQAFLDGNKRTGMAAALTFLELNGVTVPVGTDRLHQAMIAIAEKRMDRGQLATVFREMTAK